MLNTLELLRIRGSPKLLKGLVDGIVVNDKTATISGAMRNRQSILYTEMGNLNQVPTFMHIRRTLRGYSLLALPSRSMNPLPPRGAGIMRLTPDKVANEFNRAIGVW